MALINYLIYIELKLTTYAHKLLESIINKIFSSKLKNKTYNSLTEFK